MQLADRSPILLPAVVLVALGFVAEMSSTPWSEVEVWTTDLVPGVALISSGVGVALVTRLRWAAWALLAAGGLWFAANLAVATSGPASDLFDLLSHAHRGLLVASLLLLTPTRASGVASTLVVLTTLIPPLMRAPIPMLAWAAGVVLGGSLVIWNSRGPGRQRRVLGLGLACGTVAGAAALTSYAASEVVASLATSAYLAGMTASAGAVLYAALSHRADPASVTDALVKLALGPLGTTREQLAAALGDPQLDVAFATPGGWIDDLGQSRNPLPRTPGRERLTVTIDATLVAELSCRKDIASARRVVTSIEAATRLAARNASLRAALRTEADQLRNSRLRLLLRTAYVVAREATLCTIEEIAVHRDGDLILVVTTRAPLNETIRDRVTAAGGTSSATLNGWEIRLPCA